MKITVITPSYNDAKSITETLDSLRNQTYTNWESIIIDDGSTDDTKEVIKAYKDKYDKEDKIKYIYQENSDQLNAIINGSKYITGDYVYLLHSDDLIPDDNFFENAVEFMKKNPEYDAIIGDLIIINGQTEVTNRWKALKYRKRKSTPVLLMLNNGANIYGDFSLQKKEVFQKNVINNYLTWNTPFWLDLSDNAEMLNIKTVDFPILKYRIHEDNYANNEIGKFNALNGELRTLTRLMSYYEVPMFSLQRAILKFIRMPGIRKLKLTAYYKPIYVNKPTKNKYKLVKLAIENTYKKGEKLNPYLEALLGFYKNNKNRTITLNEIPNKEIYKGKDIRLFANKLYKNELSDFYNNFLDEMQKGFSEIIVNNEQDKQSVEDITKFLCIYPYVKITVQE